MNSKIPYQTGAKVNRLSSSSKVEPSIQQTVQFSANSGAAVDKNKAV
ncbi:MAG TPA: hypothetical protein V6D10_25460 [Trichocoleus sp.]|jgi:hypothetical protein